MANKGSFRRKAVGAGALGLVALGIWLGRYFPGFGLGPGLGFGTGSSQSGGEQQGADPGTSSSGEPEATLVSVKSPGVAPMQPAAPPVERLRVVIDGDRYLLAESVDAEPSVVVSAEDIARRAAAATGDDQGIRIRIERTKEATTGARQTLIEALNAAGVERDQRQESVEFLNLPR